MAVPGLNKGSDVQFLAEFSFCDGLTLIALPCLMWRSCDEKEPGMVEIRWLEEHLQKHEVDAEAFALACARVLMI